MFSLAIVTLLTLSASAGSIVGRDAVLTTRDGRQHRGRVLSETELQAAAPLMWVGYTHLW